MTARAQPKRAPRFGPEPWKEAAGLSWSLWDLWFCVIAVLDHDGDLEVLADTFVDTLRNHRALQQNPA